MRENPRKARLIPLHFSSKDEPDFQASGQILHWRVVQRSRLWRPPTDIYETEKDYVVLVEIAGMRQKEFSILFDKKKLSIRGSRQDSKERKAYHQMEIAYGEFATEIEVPVAVEVSAIEATYSDGFLKVLLPKKSPTQISIKD
jgi:HSP20 family molecular chaperone IbpA